MYDRLTYRWCVGTGEGGWFKVECGNVRSRDALSIFGFITRNVDPRRCYVFIKQHAASDTVAEQGINNICGIK